MSFKVIHTYNEGPPAALAKRLRLTFDKKFGYCTSGTHFDGGGGRILKYIALGKRVFSLKYYAGCFKPYLVEYDTKGLALTKAKGEYEPKVVALAHHKGRLKELKNRCPGLIILS